MRKKMTPTQTMAGLAGTLAFCYIATVIVWKWPDSSNWVLGVWVMLFAVFLFLFYRAVRKKEPPD